MYRNYKSVWIFPFWQPQIDELTLIVAVCNPAIRPGRSQIQNVFA